MLGCKILGLIRWNGFILNEFPLLVPSRSESLRTRHRPKAVAGPSRRTTFLIMARAAASIPTKDAAI